MATWDNTSWGVQSIPKESIPKIQSNLDYLYNSIGGSSDVVAQIATKAPLASPSFTGVVSLPSTTMTGALNEVSVTMASAAVVNIGAAAGNTITVTGTATITAFDTVQAGVKRTLRFSSPLTITHNALSLILPGSTSLVVGVGDVIEFASFGGGNWRCTSYQPMDRTIKYSSLSSGVVYHYKDLVAYNNSTGTVTGTIKITLPVSWTSTMLQIKLAGYGHGTGVGGNNINWNAELSGYNYSLSAIWDKASVTLSPTCPFTSIRFGHDGTYCCILLGTTSSSWIHPKITITDVIASHSSPALFSSGWAISLITDETGITISNTPTPNILATTGGGVYTGSLAITDGVGIDRMYLSKSGSIELGDILGTSTAGALAPFIDWHYAVGSAQDYNVRQTNSRDGAMIFQGTTTNSMEVCCYGQMNGTRHGFMLGTNGAYGYLDYDTSGNQVRLSALNNIVFGFNNTAAHNSNTFTERIRLTSAGSLGIGTTNPQATLHSTGTTILGVQALGGWSPIGNNQIGISSDSQFIFLSYRDASGGTHQIKLTLPSAGSERTI